MGIPVVATDVKGNREIVEDGETGFLVPLDSPQEMATRLAMLIANTQLRRQMGAKGQVFVREQFDESTIAKRLVSIYSELLGREGASSRAKYEGS